MNTQNAEPHAARLSEGVLRTRPPDPIEPEADRPPESEPAATTPPPSAEGTIQVTLRYAGRDRPLPEDDPWCP